MLMAFLLCTFQLPVEELENKLANLSIVLLTFVAILDNNRSELPAIQSTTIADRFIMLYILTSCLPIAFVVGLWFEENEGEYIVQNEINQIVEYVSAAIYGVSFIILAVLYRNNKRYLGLPVPEQRKVEGKKGAPDTGWTLDDQHTKES